MPTRSFRPFLLAFAFALAFAACAAASETAVGGEGPGPRCGGTLWRLMTLSDPQRRSVTMDARPTTIAKLAALRAPRRIVPARTTGFQRTTWRLHAVVDRYRIASNGEIVLILFSIDSGQFMNAYLPASQCLGERARGRTRMLAARRSLTSRCPTVTAAWQLLGVTVDVTGVGFWNPSKATRGSLPNGAELRPLTSLEIVSGCGVG